MTEPDTGKRLEEPLVTELVGELPGWRRDGDAITKSWKLKDFKAAMAFVDKIADAANAADHHPDIHVESYSRVRLVLSTHSAGGLTRADIRLARTIEKLATPAV